MCKLDILQAYDFRPEMDRSCPASTGSDFSTPPAAASADLTSSPVLVRAGVETEREEGGSVTAANSACDEVIPETVITASVSTSVRCGASLRVWDCFYLKCKSETLIPLPDERQRTDFPFSRFCSLELVYECVLCPPEMGFLNRTSP